MLFDHTSGCLYVEFLCNRLVKCYQLRNKYGLRITCFSVCISGWIFQKVTASDKHGVVSTPPEKQQQQQQQQQKLSSQLFEYPQHFRHFRQQTFERAASLCGNSYRPERIGETRVFLNSVQFLYYGTLHSAFILNMIILNRRLGTQPFVITRG